MQGASHLCIAGHLGQISTPQLVRTVPGRSCYPTGSSLQRLPGLGKTCSRMHLWDKNISRDRQTDVWRQLVNSAQG